MRKVRSAYYLPAKRTIRWTFIVCLILTGFIAGVAVKESAAAAKEKAAPPPPSLETLQPKSMDDVNQLLSRLSDEQVRQILIQQLAKSLPSKKPEPSGSLNRLEAFSVLVQQRLSDLGSYRLQFFPNSAQVVQKLTDGEGPAALGEMGLGLIVIIGLALLVEWFCWRFSAGMRKRFDTAPAMQGWMRFNSALLRILPNLLGIVIFTVMSGLLYALLPVSQKWGWRPLFIAAMLLIVSIRLIMLLSRLIFSPKAPSLRLVALSDTTAAQLHWFSILLLSVIVVINVLGLLVQKLEIPMDGLYYHHAGAFHTSHRVNDDLALALPNCGGGPFARNGAGRIRRSVLVPQSIRSRMAHSGDGLCRHGLFFCDRPVGAVRPADDAAFLISILIVPFYLILNQLGKWLVRESLSTVQKTQVDENTRYFRIALNLVRLIIGFALALWLLDIWGIELTFISSMVNAVFSILLTLILAHMIWSQTNRYIERKLFVPAPTEAQTEAQEEEFASITLSRSHTLLPVMRKFLGVVLVVMVTLIVLSSLGINITPLMAGAGVVGLAIGFGSQRLVTDVLSGIFYLIDDAFRVGEYIEAGGISGGVEGFTLRNVKLRSDKGALQLIPFSKLGTITNYNRGGMVIKFSLALPADTDIEKVRKIIKKVGQKIQENPEFGPDLIRPIKSMGVKSIIDSVMTFRVKFTAKAGKQFLIQREAFMRVREALAKEGIHFASRKVIVEFPPGYEKAKDVNPAGPGPSPEDVLKAGAAAAVTQLLDEEAQKKAALAKKKPA